MISLSHLYPNLSGLKVVAYRSRLINDLKSIKPARHPHFFLLVSIVIISKLKDICAAPMKGGVKNLSRCFPETHWLSFFHSSKNHEREKEGFYFVTDSPYVPSLSKLQDPPPPGISLFLMSSTVGKGCKVRGVYGVCCSFEKIPPH